jgi:hypothetical protein
VPIIWPVTRDADSQQAALDKLRGVETARRQAHTPRERKRLRDRARYWRGVHAGRRRRAALAGDHLLEAMRRARRPLHTSEFGRAVEQVVGSSDLPAEATLERLVYRDRRFEKAGDGFWAPVAWEARQKAVPHWARALKHQRLRAERMLTAWRDARSAGSTMTSGLAERANDALLAMREVARQALDGPDGDKPVVFDRDPSDLDELRRDAGIED